MIERNPDDWLLGTKLRATAARLAEGVDEAEAEKLWTAAEADLEAAGADEDTELAVPILDRSLEQVQEIIAAWDDGSRHPPPWDRAVLKRALKSYRKRLKLVRLDDESSSGRNPLSKGESSGITGVKAPEQYTRDIWDVLIAQGKLRDAGYGLLELAE